MSRGGTFTFLLLSERKGKESFCFPFFWERKVIAFLTFLSEKERKGKLGFFILLETNIICIIDNTGNKAIILI